jgi:hypothetical protein
MSDYSYFNDEDINNFRSVYEETMIYCREALRALEISDKAFVDRREMRLVALNYAADIRRLSDFHELTDGINGPKQWGYLAYWFMKINPIQIVNPYLPEPDDHYIYSINAVVIVHIIMKKTCESLHVNWKIAVGEEIIEPYREFFALLLYNLKLPMN